MKQHQLIDYHLHTAVTIDGKMNEMQACDRAIQLGIQEIAFTNHVMLTEPDYLVSLENFAKHWEQIQACQKHNPELTIRLGLEVDYYEGRDDEVAALIRQYEAAIGRSLDLVLGSVHHLKGVFFSHKQDAQAFYKNNNVRVLYRDYFILAAKAVKSGLFDVMAHPDQIKKYEGEYSPHLPFEEYRDVVEPYLDAVLATNVGLEVNTKGYKLKVGEAYPTVELLRLYLDKAKELGKEPIITLGSDAHKVDDVGGFLLEGAAMLKELGLYSVARFEKHKPTAFKL